MSFSLMLVHRLFSQWLRMSHTDSSLHQADCNSASIDSELLTESSGRCTIPILLAHLFDLVACESPLNLAWTRLRSDSARFLLTDAVSPFIIGRRNVLVARRLGL